MIKRDETRRLKENGYSIQNEKIENPFLEGKIDDLIVHYDSDKKLKDEYIKDIRFIENKEHYIVEVELKDKKNLTMKYNEWAKLSYLSNGSYPGELSHVLGARSDESNKYLYDKSLEDILITKFNDSSDLGAENGCMFFCKPTNAYYAYEPNDNMLIFNKGSLERRLDDLTQDMFGLSAEEYISCNLKKAINNPSNKLDYSGCISSNPSNRLSRIPGDLSCLFDTLVSSPLENGEYKTLFPFKEGTSEEGKNPVILLGFLNLVYSCANKYLKLVRNNTQYADHFINFADNIKKGVDNRWDIPPEDKFYSFLTDKEILKAEESDTQFLEKKWEYSPRDCDDEYGMYLKMMNDSHPLGFGDASMIMSKGRLGTETIDNIKPRILHLYKKSDLE